MEKKVLKLKKNKQGSFISSLFKDRKNRYLAMFIMMLPFIIAIAVFGSIAFKEGKVLLNLAKGSAPVETKPENIIESMGYILRDNPTDIQKEYFKELKEAIEEEHEEPIDDATIAGMVAKNYIVDFYTWTNKQGKYDVGGIEYIYDGEFENSEHYKENVYLSAKDGFYKYMSTYATQYGKENLLEVEDVSVISKKMPDKYVINEHSSWKQDSDGEWYDYRIDVPYDWFYVQCRWTYKPTDKLTLSKFATSVNLAIIKNKDGVYQIVEASENTINARKGSEEDSAVEETDGIEKESENN